MADYEGLKNEVLSSARWLCDNGFFGAKLGSGGNVSLFMRAENLIVITPSRIPYHKMSLNDICVIDPQLNLIEGHLPPSMESPMHAGVYKSRSDVKAVVHTHQMFASVLALIKQPIPALFDEITYEIGSEVAVILNFRKFLWETRDIRLTFASRPGREEISSATRISPGSWNRKPTCKPSGAIVTAF